MKSILVGGYAKIIGGPCKGQIGLVVRADSEQDVIILQVDNNTAIITSYEVVEQKDRSRLAGKE